MLKNSISNRTIDTVAKLLHTHFSTDQSYYVKQQSDGSYRKKSGEVNPNFLANNLKDEGSIAIYQKNNDSTVNWICFDFDVLARKLGSNEAKIELNNAVSYFCHCLNELDISYLLEFSGNRGFHVWITFDENTSYRIGYDIQQAILDKVDLKYSKDLIAIDLFPKSNVSTDGVGLGVKIPLSKHTKSGRYSILLESINSINTYTEICDLNCTVIEEQIAILEKHAATNKSQIESRLGVFFDLSHDDRLSPARIKMIRVANRGFSFDTIMTHWQSYAPLKKLADKITIEKTLNNEERKLIVGIFCNVYRQNHLDFGNNILHNIFKNTANYNYEITARAIKALSSFHFPSQPQIEKTVGIKFKQKFELDELLSYCIPKYKTHEDATLEISKKDVEISRIAELNYLFLNDEVQSQIIINELSAVDDEELLNKVKETLAKPCNVKYYTHSRNEGGGKMRTLVTLQTSTRVTTSFILKQLVYLFGIQPNHNSHGYHVNKGFKEGFIFQPWLYLWIKFISNISKSIADPANLDFYIVKTDIKNFYNNIPHDNVKRLLFGEVNTKIDQKIKHLSKESSHLYKSYIDSLFKITETITKSKIGLPQGPAYARYLAELYLDNIDELFDSKIRAGELILYQRYVDDIFFVAPSATIAKKYLDLLNTELKLLGLEINSDKTITSKIRNFNDNFNKYRSQSKYAVDRVSRNFDGATETQKDMAINEFMALVEADTCNDDLAFIFSHLTGVPQLDNLKMAKVLPTLLSGVGRGSLYKHLFNFVLENPDNWNKLKCIEKFTILQSEVLTAAFINAIETDKHNAQALSQLLQEIVPRLSIEKMVSEHLAYLSINNGIIIETKKLEPQAIINCLISTENVENLKITNTMVNHLNSALNTIKSLPEFINVMYPLCATTELTSRSLNELASTFYSKLANDEQNDVLSLPAATTTQQPTATKFYYLLCLFSVSNKNSSTELLKSMWKYCAHLFNQCDKGVKPFVTSNWFKKIGDLEIDNDKVLLIIAAIIDGNIFRGLDDKKKVFENFHNLLLIFIAFQQKDNNIADIDTELDKLKDEAEFYSWILDRDNTVLFPNSKMEWFERNVIENSTIILKNENSILFRKPTANFHPSSMPRNEHNGYSETKVDYDVNKLDTINELLADMSVRQRLTKLISIIKTTESAGNFPNIFCNEKTIYRDTLQPFDIELAQSNNLIFENEIGMVESSKNNQRNFIKYFLKIPANEPHSKIIALLNDRYIYNLDPKADVFEFLKQLQIQLENIAGIEDEFHCDIAVAAAYYLSLSKMDPTRKLEQFVNQYHKFNKEQKDQHIYGVKQDMQLHDDNPINLLKSVEASLKLVVDEAIPALAFYLADEVKNHESTLKSIAEQNSNDSLVLDINQFTRIYPRMQPRSETINIDGRKYKYSDIKLFNIIDNDLQQFESLHAVIINSAEHIYYQNLNSTIYVVAISSGITNIYNSIEQRLSYIRDKNIAHSYSTISMNTLNTTSLNKFHIARDKIATHRDIPKSEAEEIVTKWLRSIPIKFHQPLVTLIAAHEIMSLKEIQTFINTVRTLIGEPHANPFLIKEIWDYNGTHRILYKEDIIGRDVASLAPHNIAADAINATIIVDNIITGSQINDAIEYYVTGKNINPKNNPNFFDYEEKQQKQLQQKLKGLTTIEICTVLYTQKAIENIERQCKKLINEDIKVVVRSGRDIGANAFFGSTELIGANEKETIRNLLGNQELMKELQSHLDYKATATAFDNNLYQNVDTSNLVARYKSLPKKCFDFLRKGLRQNTKCHPLTRVAEINENKRK